MCHPAYDFDLKLFQARRRLPGHLPAVPLRQAAGRAPRDRLPEILAQAETKVTPPRQRRGPLPQGQGCQMPGVHEKKVLGKVAQYKYEVVPSGQKGEAKK